MNKEQGGSDDGPVDTTQRTVDERERVAVHAPMFLREAAELSGPLARLHAVYPRKIHLRLGLWLPGGIPEK